jgi:predicted ester cyclase
VEENKALRRRVLAEIEVAGSPAAIDELCTPDMVIYGMGEPLRGREAQKAFTAVMHAAFTDFEGEIHDLVAEGDAIASRWTFRGTHTGDLMGIPPTGKRITMSGMDVSRFVGEQLAEMRVVMDQLGILQQLRVIPSPGQ